MVNLNESKGYDLYCESMFKILDKYRDWKAISIGEEKRFQQFPTHKRHFDLGQISHKKVLKYLSQSEIAIIPSRWEEPFGRTLLRLLLEDVQQLFLIMEAFLKLQIMQ